ncbi:MAG: methylated-DNA-[protein]-cysteine S-methyltransferase [Actinomycetota bacterium]|jgi:methylated-DNA-[protein]-cysteine S-methyltransferase|nr:methylated-DNA-[protein]-cysteine S-methyltransferase [Actinomycetota bacterium]
MYIRHSTIGTDEIDDVILVAEDLAISGIYFPQHWTKPDWSTFGPAVDVATDPVISEAADQLRDYLRGERTSFDFDIVLHGNEFQQRVWKILEEIPFGQTRTYGDIAEQLGDRALARMVGQAVGHNPVSIVVGCHRVVGKSGSLTGYAGGLQRKAFLLDLEEPSGTRLERLF